MKCSFNPFRMLLLFAGFLLLTTTAYAWEVPPEQFPTGSAIIGSDQNGNAIVISYEDDGAQLQAFYYTAATDEWTGPDLISDDPDPVYNLSVDNSGRALVVWRENGTDLRSSYYNGTTWIQGFPDPFGTTDTNDIFLNMNGPNTALATWDFGGDSYASFFNAGIWTSPAVIVPGGGYPLNSYSENGTAIVTFYDAGIGFYALNYNGTTWSAPVPLDSNVNENVQGIDANGRAVVVYRKSNSLYSRTYNGSIWLPAVLISSNADTNLSLGMASNGTAVAAWTDSVGNGFSSSYNGSTWSTPILFGTSVADPDGGNSAEVAVNDIGDALVLFKSGDDIYARRLPFGTNAWGQTYLLAQPFGDSFETRVGNPSLSNNGFGFALWYNCSEGCLVFGSVDRVLSPPLPPINPQGRVCKMQFAAQSDRTNIITWTASPTTTVVSYVIRRNGSIIGTVLAGNPLIFEDHNRCKKRDIYTVAAVFESGIESEPVTVIFN